MIETPLFQGDLVRLAAFDPDKDAALLSQWMHDVTFIRDFSGEIAMPKAPVVIKRQATERAKKAKDAPAQTYFTIRTLADDRLVGVIDLDWVNWSHGFGSVLFGIGLPTDRGRGYAADALKLFLRYAFHELNLRRLRVSIGADNARAQQVLLKAGFTLEVRRRQLLRRDGNVYDRLVYGLLREEWETGQAVPLTPNPTNIATPVRPTLTTPMLQSERVRLVIPNSETDAETRMRWSQNSLYQRLLDFDPPRLITLNETKEFLDDPEHAHSFFFFVRTVADNQLIGLVGIDSPWWHHGDGFVGIGIGDADYWGKGYGTEMMQAILRFAFHELNLRRVSLNVFEYNSRAIRSYEKCGFVHEGRERHAFRRDGRAWDLLYMGILREEWETLTH